MHRIFMNSKNNRLIAFDYDGVIVDSMKVNREITNAVCGKFADVRKITRDDIENLDQMSFQEVAKIIGISDDILPACLLEINRRVVESYPDLSIFNGMRQLIEKLARENHILAVVTHNTEKAVHLFLKKHGIKNCFTYIMGAEQKKSKREMLKLLRETNEIPDENFFMIGDSVGDIREAKAANFRPVAVSWGYQSIERLSSAEPEFTVDNPSEIDGIWKITDERN